MRQPQRDYPGKGDLLDHPVERLIQDVPTEKDKEIFLDPFFWG